MYLLLLYAILVTHGVDSSHKLVAGRTLQVSSFSVSKRHPSPFPSALRCALDKVERVTVDFSKNGVCQFDPQILEVALIGCDHF